MRLGGRERGRVDAVLVLLAKDRLHRFAVGFGAENDVASAVEVSRAAHDLAEVLEDLQALHGMVQVAGDGVVCAADGAGLGRAAGADVVALE
jgi:hypothetical protein